MIAPTSSLKALSCAFFVALAGCGGGGAGPVTGATIVITVANRDSVAHAAATSVLGSSPAGTIPVAVNPFQLGGVMPISAQTLNKRVVSASARRSYPQAVVGPYTYPCDISGSVVETDDALDENGAPSVGDMMTLVYDDCQDLVGETVNGSMSIMLTQISSTPAPSGSAHVSLTQISVSGVHHTMTLHGSMRLYCTQASAPVETMRMATEGPLAVSVSTHVGYSDSLVLQESFVDEDTYDASLDRAISTISGHVQSTDAGSVVEVSTPATAPITRFGVDAYPRAGAALIRGKSSQPMATILSATSV